MSNLLSAQQCAEKLSLSVQTVISLAKSGRLPASFIARRWRFDPSDVEFYILSQTRGK